MTLPTTTIVTTVVPLARALDDRGCDRDGLFKRAGLDPGKLGDPNARYPVEGTRKLWKLAVEATGDPALGLTVSRYVHPTNFHALGFSWFASHSLLDALKRVIRFHRIVNDAVVFTMEESGEVMRLVYHFPPDRLRPADEGIDMGMAFTVHLCRSLRGSELTPNDVSMQRARPADTSAYVAFFGVPVTFAAPQNAITFELAELKRVLPTGNAELARTNDLVAAAYLARFDRSRLDERVRMELVRQLPSGEPSQEHIARTLNVSLRNLQRKLAQRNTSYREILNDTRMYLATHYLTESRYSVSEIAYLLGFSDPSNFSRAFRRWTGIAPGEYRTRH